MTVWLLFDHHVHRTWTVADFLLRRYVKCKVLAAFAQCREATESQHWRGKCDNYRCFTAARHVVIIRLQQGHMSWRSPGKSKVKESRNRSGVAQRVPGGLGSQIS